VIPVVVTGPVGVGRSAVTWEMTGVFDEHRIAYARFDAGALHYRPLPPDDRLGERGMLRAAPRLAHAGGGRGVAISRPATRHAAVALAVLHIPALDRQQRPSPPARWEDDAFES
jgi:hypothetical protein